MREFTRARVARACADVLRRAGVAGVLPTPLEAVQEAAGVRARVALPPTDERRILGALWFEERALFVDTRQSVPRRRFTEAHELVHLLCPWHAAVLRVDTAAELFGELALGIEAEANFGAGELLFQGAAFRDEAEAHERSLSTAFALAPRYGASRHAAAHRYVEDHADAVALAVAGRWPARDGRLPLWRGVESAAFRSRFGPVAGLLADAALDVREGPLAEAIDAARRSAEPVAAALGGFRVEVVNNRHCHLVFVSAPAPCARRAA
ncbi:MAG TPA: ImmA/IrrE family metallo-endopeptidase [Solirubrobacter sp.]|nr:ImmA/IrrE family metallo-endopeptidase [Solirubrobacter sp.]